MDQNASFSPPTLDQKYTMIVFFVGHYSSSAIPISSGTRRAKKMSR
jgi:hypothetical protein